jgi:hypothetical protein
MNVRRPIAPLPKPEDSLDTDDLKSLSTFHFVGAGLDLLGSLVCIARFASMHAALNNPHVLQNQKLQPLPEVVQMVNTMMWMRVMIGLWFAVAIILNILSGVYLRARKHRIFSLVVAGLNCLQVPLGTLLGVFTFVVLDRQSVKELYEAKR